MNAGGVPLSVGVFSPRPKESRKEESPTNEPSVFLSFTRTLPYLSVKRMHKKSGTEGGKNGRELKGIPAWNSVATRGKGVSSRETCGITPVVTV